MVTKTKQQSTAVTKVPAKKAPVKKVGRSGQTAGAVKPVVTDKKKASDAPQDAAVVVSRSRKPVTKATFTDKPAPVVGKKIQNAGISGAHAQPGKLNNSSISGAHMPSDTPLFKKTAEATQTSAKKVAAKKSAVVKSHTPSNPSETPVPNSSKQSASSSKPTTAKTERRVNHGSPIGNKDAMAEIIAGIQQAHVSEKENAKFLDLVVAMVKDGAGRFFGVSTYERLIRAALTAEQIKARKPLFMGLAGALTREQALAVETHPDTDKTDAVTAEIKELLEKSKPDNLSRKDVSRVVRREIVGNVTHTELSINPSNLTTVLTSAFERADATLLRFRPHERSALRSFVLFFERFWGVIENRQETNRPFQKDEFQRFVLEDIPGLLEHGEYARFTFSCGSRVIVHNTFAGAATISICENEFMSYLRTVPVASKEELEEQAEKNPPGFVFWTTIMNSLSALVRCDVDQPGLSLMVLNRVFGDPVSYALSQGDFNLATSVEDTLDHLVDCEARAVRKAA